MSLWETAIKEAAEKVPGKEMQDGDYKGDDGLLYCGKCNTKKQTRIHVLGKDRIVPIMCQCEQEKREADLAERKAEAHKITVERLKRDCFQSAELERCTFEDDDKSNPRVSNAMRQYAEKWEEVKADNMGLLLYGPVGTGKTFAAACIANALIEKEVPVMMTSFSRIVNTLQSSFEGRQQYIDRIVSYPLLIIDDLGAERGSDYMLEQVYSVVDARYQTGLPLIVTTNIPIAEIKEPADLKYKRIYDRILERCHPVEITGPSRRRESVKANFRARNNLLGL